MLDRDDESLERENAAGLRLLISLLIRYPEIGSLRYLPDKRSLVLDFYIRPMQTAQFEPAAVEEKIKQHIVAYLALTGQKYEIVTTKWTELENVSRLTLERDLKSVSLSEVSLIVTLLAEALAGNLLVEKGPINDDEEMWFQGEMFVDGLLESMRRESPRQSLLGIREEGRVMVFNQWLKDGKIK